VIAIAWVVAVSQAASLEAREVRVDVAIDSTGAARVRQTYALSSVPRSITFRHLNVPCATVSGVPLAGAAESAPWRDFTAVDTGPDSITVAYDVRSTGDQLSVPILFPTLPVAPNEETGRGVVALRVVVPAGYEPVLPHLVASDSPGVWTARMIAVPSLVRVRRAGFAPCGEAARGDAGPFDRTFAAFVGTMALWLPIYFTWVHRRREPRE
jgi:hypothetical protein